MISRDKITEIFCLIDDFCKEFEKAKAGHILNENNDVKQRNRSSKLSDSEVTCILVLFHYGQFRNLKHFYIDYVCVHMK